MDATRIKLARSIGILALGAGVAANLLLRTDAWGLNFALFTISVLSGGFLVAARSGIEVNRKAAWLLLPAGAFGLLFLWRDASELKIANFVGLAIAALLLAERLRLGKLWSAYALEYSAVLIQRVFELPVHAWNLVAREAGWATVQSEERKKSQMAMVRGVVLTVPILCVFGGLLVNADSLFESTISTAFDFDVVEVWLTMMTIAAAAVCVAGLSARALLAPSEPYAPGKKTILGATEAAILLGALNLLFGLFVVVQVRYLFGGAGMVQLTEGLTYAEYARRGFFELVAVSGMVIPLLLIVNSVVDDGHEKARITWLSRIMALLMLVIVASALVRMGAYVQAYGLTMLRLYTSAFICWIALVFVWILFTTLGRRERMMPFGAVLAGWACILALNVVNPDGLMARVNTRIANLDAHYLTSLSADAVPEVIAALPSIAPEKRKVLEEWLRTEWSGPEADWREWNVGRADARRWASTP